MGRFDDAMAEAAALRDPKAGALRARIWRRPSAAPPQDRGGRDRILCGRVRCGGEFPVDYLRPDAVKIPLDYWHLADDGIWYPGRGHRQRRNRFWRAAQVGDSATTILAEHHVLHPPFWFRCPIPDCNRVSVVTVDALRYAFGIETR